MLDALLLLEDGQHKNVRGNKWIFAFFLLFSFFPLETFLAQFLSHSKRATTIFDCCWALRALINISDHDQSHLEDLSLQKVQEFHLSSGFEA